MSLYDPRAFGTRSERFFSSRQPIFRPRTPLLLSHPPPVVILLFTSQALRSLGGSGPSLHRSCKPTLLGPFLQAPCLSWPSRVPFLTLTHAAHFNATHTYVHQLVRVSRAPYAARPEWRRRASGFGCLTERTPQTSCQLTHLHSTPVHPSYDFMPSLSPAPEELVHLGRVPAAAHGQHGVAEPPAHLLHLSLVVQARLPSIQRQHEAHHSAAGVAAVVLPCE